MQKLKERWNVTSNWQLAIIFIVFAVTGSSSVIVTRPLLNTLGIVKANFSQPFFYYAIRIVLVFVAYQILLVLYGWLFGQFKFFWAFEKKMLKRLGFGRFLKDD